MLKITIVLLGIAGAMAYPSGPPVTLKFFNGKAIDICKDMFPHGHNESEQTSTPPFKIAFKPKCFKAGSDVEVTVTSNAAKDFFEGIFVQAREDKSSFKTDMGHGEFSAIDKTLSALDCFNPKGAIGQNEKAHYVKKMFTWTAPKSGFTKNITFVATMVHETEDFWRWVKSEPVSYDSECSGAPAIGLSAITILSLLVTRVLLF